MLRSRFGRVSGRAKSARNIPLSRSPFHSSSHLASASASPPPPLPQQVDHVQRILRRTPRFLRPTVSALYNAPLTHITAFVILHELTAVIPLVGLAGAFHYFQWLPPFFAEGKWVVSGVEKFGRYFRRKGWIQAGDEQEARSVAENGKAGVVEITQQKKGRASKWWGRGETGTRLLVEVATAYAVVKVMLPLRLVVSVWGAPWFARWTVVPFNRMIQRLFRKRSKPGGTDTTNMGKNAPGKGGAR